MLFKGILIGILVSAPMGPIGMLCIQRTLNKGRWHGFVTGLGAALSDLIYAVLTALGMGFAINFIEANEAPLQLFGSLVLLLFGFYIFKSNPVKSLQKNKEKKLSLRQDFITSFFLTFSNALIIFLFIGLYARLGFVLKDQSWWITLGGIGSIAVGALLWWFGITYLVSRLSKWINMRGLWIMNKIVGSIIIILSIVGVLSVFLTSYFQLPLL
jgi:threonine/homoserine/homoserine lactone efflux protein